jgi:hypothetical protein
MVAVAEDKAGKAHHEIKFILKRRRELTSENNRLRANNIEITERNRELERENQRLRAQLEAPTCSFCLVNVAVRPLAGCGHRVCCNDPQCVAGSSHHQWRRCFVCNALRADKVIEVFETLTEEQKLELHGYVPTSSNPGRSEVIKVTLTYWGRLKHRETTGKREMLLSD